ncbi:MAG: AraC family transcriptional regulator [Victivallales bacterium]|jgi:AraC family transcriptional regulator of arabinose operon
MGMAIHRAVQIDKAAPLPLYLRATGWYTASKGWTEKDNGKARQHCGLFWCMNGNGSFGINNNKYTLKAGQALYYLPHEADRIVIKSPSFTYYWVTFDGPQAENFLKSFKYPRSPFYVQECLVSYFEEMFEILHDLTPDGLQRGSQAVYRFLIAIGSRTAASKQNSSHQRLVKDFMELTANNFKNESFNVNAAAEILKVHRTNLGRALKKQLNISPNTYIINMRLQHALKMLYETNLKVAEIAFDCGIPDPCYFSKQIKQLTGLSPNKLRNNRT